MSLKAELISMARQLGVEIADEPRAAVTIHAVNHEAYGAQNVLLSDGRRYRALFKRCRTPGTHAALVERLNQLRSLIERPAYHGVRSQLVVGQVCENQNGSWLVFPFVDGRNGYVDIRSQPGSHRVVSRFRRALRLARRLEDAASQRLALSEIVEQSNERLAQHGFPRRVPQTCSNLQLPIGLAHLDFVPDNLLFGPAGDRLVDFEYWDHAPVIWNLFDIMTSFGSLAGLSPLTKRSPSDLLRIFGRPESSAMQSLWDRTREYLCESCLNGLTRPEVVSLVYAWLAAKLTAQSRVYGRAYGFSRDWDRLWEESGRGWIDSLAERWPGEVKGVDDRNRSAA